MGSIFKRSMSNTWGDRLGSVVCQPCDKFLSKRYSALGWNQCHRRGQAFDACVMMLTLVDQLDEDEPDVLS